MVTIKSKIFKSGNSYAVRVPKALIESKVFEENGKVYEFELLPDITKGSFFSLNENIHARNENLAEIE